MSTRHIARSGQKAGQWVPCSAKTACRNGGTHVSPEDLHAARELHRQETGETVSLTKVPLTDVISFATATDEEKNDVHDVVTKTREEATAKREAKAQAKREQEADIARAVRALPEVLAEAEAQRMAKNPKLLAQQTIDEIYNILNISPPVGGSSALSPTRKAKLIQLGRNFGLSEEDRGFFLTVAVVASEHRYLRKSDTNSPGLGKAGYEAWFRTINLSKAAQMVREQPTSKIYQKLFQEEIAETVTMGKKLLDEKRERAEVRQRQEMAKQKKAAIRKKILNLFWRTD